MAMVADGSRAWMIRETVGGMEQLRAEGEQLTSFVARRTMIVSQSANDKLTTMARQGIGIWLIGAKGGVAATTAVGLTALKRGLVGELGLVSGLPQFRGLGLADWHDFTVGGHEIRDVRLADEAMRLATASRAIDPHLIQACRPELPPIHPRAPPPPTLKTFPPPHPIS